MPHDVDWTRITADRSEARLRRIAELRQAWHAGALCRVRAILLDEAEAQAKPRIHEQLLRR